MGGGAVVSYRGRRTLKMEEEEEGGGESTAAVKAAPHFKDVNTSLDHNAVVYNRNCI